MNAPAPHIRRNRDADRAKATELVTQLGAIARQIAPGTDDSHMTTEQLAGLRETAAQIGFAADLLGAYAAGLALATPDPITSAYLVERYTPAEAMPEIEETVLVWTDEDDDPWLGWFDGLTWWFVDAMPISRVKAWARRPGVAL